MYKKTHVCFEKYIIHKAELLYSKHHLEKEKIYREAGVPLTEEKEAPDGYVNIDVAENTDPGTRLIFINFQYPDIIRIKVPNMCFGIGSILYDFHSSQYLQVKQTDETGMILESCPRDVRFLSQLEKIEIPMEMRYGNEV